MAKQSILLIIVILIIMTGCKAGDSKYSKLILKDYKTSIKYKGYYEKEKNPNPQYYKLKTYNRFWQEEIFLVIEDDSEKSEVNLLLAIKYRGKDWMYMKELEFISSEIYENFLLDFELDKYQIPIWKDNATLAMGVEERIAIKLEEPEIEKLEKFVNSVDLEIKLYSDYDDRTYARKVRPKEKLDIKEVLELYKELLNNYEEKQESYEKETGITEKESA